MKSIISFFKFTPTEAAGIINFPYPNIIIFYFITLSFIFLYTDYL